MSKKKIGHAWEAPKPATFARSLYLDLCQLGVLKEQSSQQDIETIVAKRAWNLALDMLVNLIKIPVYMLPPCAELPSYEEEIDAMDLPVLDDWIM